MGSLLALLLGGVLLAPCDDDRSAPAAGSDKEETPVRMIPREGRRVTIPGTHADGWAERGEIEVQAVKDTLTVSMTGAAAAHCRVGLLSSAVQTFRLVQQFDVTCADPEVTRVVLTLESDLSGALWSRHKAGASLRLARATVTPVGRPGPALRIEHPPLTLAGTQARLYRHTAAPVEGPPIPPGRYLLVMDLAFDVQASGFRNAHAVADFADEDPLPDEWKQGGDPFRRVDRKDFGFEVEISAEAADDEDDSPAPKPARRPVAGAVALPAK